MHRYLFKCEAEACKTNTTKIRPHQKIQHTMNWEQDDQYGNHQHSRKLLKMDILMSKTRWVHNEWNKIASDIKLVFHSSTISLRHSAIIIFIVIRFDNSHMPDFHLGRQQITITYNCMYQIHSMVLTTPYHFQYYPILTVICCGTS